MIKRDTKRGQVTLFVILAILLVAAVVILFYYLKPGIFSRTGGSPQIGSCISNSLDAHIKALALDAGLVNPRFNQMFRGSNYTFLCYTSDYYQPCVNQEPFLTKAFEESLSLALKSEFQACYDSSVADLQLRGYDVTRGVAKFNISIEPEGVIVEIDAPTTVSSGQSAIRTQKYKQVYKTNLYELLMVATSLIQFETYYGDSEQTTQMFYYPNILIDKQRGDDEVKFYSLTEKTEGIEYRFAVRSYSWPAGGSI